MDTAINWIEEFVQKLHSDFPDISDVFVKDVVWEMNKIHNHYMKMAKIETSTESRVKIEQELKDNWIGEYESSINPMIADPPEYKRQREFMALVVINFLKHIRDEFFPETHYDFKRLEWLGSQKELADLLVVLKKKGWITEIHNKTVKALFTKTDSIEQILKPGQTKENAYKETYEGIYTPKYKTPFGGIMDRESRV